MLEFLGLASTEILIIIVFAAFLSGVLHGTTGMAGGILMTAILSYVVGIKVAIPVMSCALILSHGSRTALYWRDIDWPTATQVLLFGIPMITAGAYIFTVLNPKVVALIFACTLLFSLPIKHWARSRKIKTGPQLLAMASIIWGLLAGNVTGPGFFLAPFLIGTGMNRLTFVGTLAFITLLMNSVKLLVFGAAKFMSFQLLILGVLIGLITIPGNWVGRTALRRMSDQHHERVIDIFTLVVIVYFSYLALV